MLPLARQLVQSADRLEQEAEAARHRPLRLAVPALCTPAALARLIAQAHGHGMLLDPRPAPPSERASLVRSQQVQAALLAVPASEATWTVRLGLGVAGDAGSVTGVGDVPDIHPYLHPSPDADDRPLYLDTLRPGRADRDRRPRRVWLQPEDDVPHIRDRLTRLRDAVGLRPAQLAVAGTVTAATADVLSRGDVLVCAPAQARELGLGWRPLGELGADLARGYALVTASGTGPEADRFRTACAQGVARCLGATERSGEAV
jgi:hypothetical protein